MFLLLVAIETLKNLSSAWSVTQRRDCLIFLFQRWGNFKIIAGNKKENEKQNWNNFDIINFTVSVWKKREKMRKSFSVCSWFWRVSHLNLYERFWFAIVATFCWNSNLNFQIVMGINLAWFLEKRIPSRYEVKCLLLSKEFCIWTVKLEITNNTIIDYMSLIPTIPSPWIMREN